MPKKKNYTSWLRKKQKTQENGKPSTKMNSENSVSYLHQQQPGSPSDYSLHRSIRTLIYDDFITILTTEELGPLIISGEPPIDELVTAWDTITDEYSNSIKTPRSTSIFDCYKKIERTKGQIKFIDAALGYLEGLAQHVHNYYEWNEKLYYDVDTAVLLTNRGYLLIEPAETYDAYLEQIHFVRTQAKTLIILINQYTNEYKLLSPDGEKVTRTRQSYMDELAILSKHQGGGFINPRSITVDMYIAIVNSFMSYNDALRQQQENQKK